MSERNVGSTTEIKKVTGKRKKEKRSRRRFKEIK
jgi:hypothetical protein